MKNVNYKTILLVIILTIELNISLSQPVIKFDFTEFDYGQIVEGSEVRKEFWFTNEGTEPLIINSVKTSDGGSMANWSKEAVAPGGKGFITFIYNTNRIGGFNKVATVNCNSSKSNFYLRIKGDVILKKTIIKVSKVKIDAGKINFGDADTVSFEITNIGKEKLYIYSSFIEQDYKEADIFCYNILAKYNSDSTRKNAEYYEPNETIQINIVLRNIYGNTGSFERNIIFTYNSHDTLNLTIKGEYLGRSQKNIIFETDCVFNYEDGKLTKRIFYSDNGKIRREDFFSNSYCTHTKEYHWNKDILLNEKFYKKGKLIETKNYKVDNY